jgi:hypothetical protein
MDTQRGISQQPFIVSSSTFKPKSMGPNQNLKRLAMNKTSNKRRLQNIKGKISHGFLKLNNSATTGQI